MLFIHRFHHYFKPFFPMVYIYLYILVLDESFCRWKFVTVSIFLGASVAFTLNQLSEISHVIWSVLSFLKMISTYISLHGLKKTSSLETLSWPKYPSKCTESVSVARVRMELKIMLWDDWVNLEPLHHISKRLETWVTWAVEDIL